MLFCLQRHAHWVECWGAAENPNGSLESTCITLCNQEGGLPMHQGDITWINPTKRAYTVLIDQKDIHTVLVLVDTHFRFGIITQTSTGGVWCVLCEGGEYT